MILGIGVDLVDVGRISGLLERHGSRAEERLFTAGELTTCGRRATAAAVAECLAARFAAKEAFLKAVGGPGGTAISWRDVEVTLSNSGNPELAVAGKAARLLEEFAQGGSVRLHLSLSHDGGNAVAVVVVEELQA